MELKIANTKKDKKAFIRFIYTLYRDDAAFCDMNVTFVRTFLYGLDSYVKRQEVIPILVEDHGRIKAECIFVIDETDEIKLSFLEFMEDAEPAVRSNSTRDSSCAPETKGRPWSASTGRSATVSES